jgi:hypothetical protein
MTNDTYLYFSDDLSSYTKASTQAAAQTVTVADGAPVNALMDMTITESNRVSGGGFWHNGLVTLKMDAAHNDASADVHLFGTHYGTVADNAVVTVSPYAGTYAAGSGTGVFTLKTVAQDPVYGITASSTASENGFTLTLNRPYLTDQFIVKPASSIIGIQALDDDNTIIKFEPTTNDASSIDSVTLTHTEDKHHLLASLLADVIADPRNNGKMIKFADGFNENYYGNNPAGITTVALSIDS